jgi:hypothetical protein
VAIQTKPRAAEQTDAHEHPRRRVLGLLLAGHDDLYRRYGPVARNLKTLIQMAIGAAAVAILAAHFGWAAITGDLPRSLHSATTQLLGGVGVALAAAAVVELAYTLFTPGPDEALDPLMLGLAAALLLLVGGLDPLAVTLGQAAALFLLGALLAALFATRLMLAERPSDDERPHIWWVTRLHKRGASGE